MTPKIVVYDGRDVQNPEDLAMLQALYSRSPAGVEEHMAKVTAQGSASFCQKYYCNYGHASIGDCGTTTIFIENVSMLAAKAIQDWPLYSGQEASTRYMDFTSAVFENPVGREEGAAVQEEWRSFYMKVLSRMGPALRERYPQQEGEADAVYERAINARAFDVARAFLPAGAHTNLSWTTNLRQASDKLRWLVVHPDPTIATSIAETIHQALIERYSNSFRPIDFNDPITQWMAEVSTDTYLLEEPRRSIGIAPDMTFSLRRSGEVATSLATRPRGAKLPHWFDEFGTVNSRFLLDFGSYRDVQRHRHGVIRMPLLTMEHGFHHWYIKQLPADLHAEVEALLGTQRAKIDAFDDIMAAQYYIPMGFMVPCDITQPFSGFIYRIELRSSKTVHPTLRAVTLEEARIFAAKFPWIPIHVDLDPDSWTIRRGHQTIVEK